jgi:hypothetical protein
MQCGGRETFARGFADAVATDLEAVRGTNRYHVTQCHHDDGPDRGDWLRGSAHRLVSATADMREVDDTALLRERARDFVLGSRATTMDHRQLHPRSGVIAIASLPLTTNPICSRPDVGRRHHAVPGAGGSAHLNRSRTSLSSGWGRRVIGLILPLLVLGNRVTVFG